MTKVLLTNSPAPQQGTSPFFCLEKRQPLGLAYLTSSLRNEGIDVDFVDNYVKPIDMRKYVKRTKPDYVGIYVNTICWQKFLQMLDTIKDLPVKIAVGGPHVSVLPESIPPEVDYVVIGEGEKAIVDIVKGNAKSRIVSYPQVDDLNNLIPPDYSIFEGTKYWEHMEFLDGRPVMPMNTSRGCPMDCNFCSVKSVWGKTYRFLSSDNIIKQIIHLMKEYSCRSFYFREDNFTLNRKRLEEFCVKAKSLDIEWVAESRIDSLDRKILKSMNESGCKGLYLGLESGSDRILNLMNKNITVKMIREKVKLIKGMGIKAMGSWVINCPGETPEDTKMTFSLADEIGCDINNFNVFCGIPTSKFYNDLLESGEYERIDDCFLIRPNGYSEWAKRIYGFAPSW